MRAYSAEVRKPWSRGSGASIASSVKTRPGRGVITTMRLREIDQLEHRMGDEDHGLSERPPEREQIVVELEAGDLVERGERLVHQQQLRFGDERARDRRRASSCRRKARADRLARRRQARRGRALRATRGAPPPASTPASLSGSRTLAATVAHGISVGSWNTKPSAARRVSGRAPATPRVPLRRLAQAGDDAQRRRLAAAGRAEQRHELAGANLEIEPIERHDAVRERLADAAQRDDGAAREMPDRRIDVAIDAAASFDRYFGRRSMPDLLVHELQRVGLAVRRSTA